MFRRGEQKKVAFSGLVVPLVTPLNEDFSVDSVSLKALTARLMNHGVRNFFVLSPIGESFYLDEAKREEVMRVVTDTVGARGKVIVGCLGLSAEDVVEKVKAAQRFSTFCAVNVPEVSIVNEISFMDFFDGLFRETKANIFLYNHPVYFKRNIPVLGIEKIAGWERIVGIIDYSKNPDYFGALLEHMRSQNVKVFQGAEESALDSLIMGCAGIAPCLAGVLPNIFLDLLAGYESMGRVDIIHNNSKIISLMKDYFPFGKRVQSYKYLLSVERLTQSYHFPQLEKLGEEEKKRLSGLAEELFV